MLDHIEGIGPKRRQALWKEFTSLEAMKTATVDDLARVEGMNKNVANTLYKFFRLDVVAKKDSIK